MTAGTGVLAWLSRAGRPMIVALACAAFAWQAAAIGAAAQSTVPARGADPALLRLQERVDALETQLRAATGESERLQFELRQAQTRIERLERHVDRLLAERGPLGAGLESAPAAAPTPGAAAAPPAPSRSGTAPAATSGTTYAEAQALLSASDYPGAERAFRGFLEANPTDDKAPDARYWLGRTLLVREAHREAAAEFLKVVRENASASVAPDALVWLGVSLRRMGETTQACAAFADLTRQFPRASASTKSLAQREARLASCPA